MATETEVIVEKQETLPTRQGAIAAALEVASREVGSVEEVEVKETKEEKKEPEKKEEAKVELTGDELLAQQGKELIQALRDPKRAGDVIEFLIKQTGYTKAEVKAAATSEAKTEELSDDILAIIKGEMGEEFDVISERLSKALNKIIPKQLEKANSDIREEFQRRESEKLQAQSATALTSIATTFFGEGNEIPDNVSAEMSKYMDRYSPSADMSVKDYIQDAFDFAVGKLRLQQPDRAKEKKISQNRTDAASRLHSSARVPGEEGVRQDNTKPITRQEAIRRAMEAAEKGN